MKLKEALEKRANLIHEARALLNKADDEKRELTAEERSQYDKMLDDAQKLKADADRMEKLEAEERQLEESRGRQTETRTAEQRTSEPKVFELRKSVDGMDRTMTITQGDEHRAAFNRALQGDDAEYRALQKDSDVGGGFLSAPQDFIARLIQGVDNDVFMRQLCTILPPLTTAGSVGAPSLDTDMGDTTWTAELSMGNEDTTLAFGKRELSPHPLSRYAKVSKRLLRSSSISPDAIVRSRLQYKCATVLENAYMNGSGAGRPLGVFTASDDGIGTARDVSTGNTTTAIKFDGLKEAKYTLNARYRAKARWLFHSDAVKMLAKIKDGDGQYIWQQSVVGNEPDRLLGFPIVESPYAPNTFTTGLYVGLLGDFSYYWIVDWAKMEIQVLTELYALTNQNAYVIRMESDGMPVLAEAFVRVTLA